VQRDSETVGRASGGRRQNAVVFREDAGKREAGTQRRRLQCDTPRGEQKRRLGRRGEADFRNEGEFRFRIELQRVQYAYIRLLQTESSEIGDEVVPDDVGLWRGAQCGEHWDGHGALSEGVEPGGGGICVFANERVWNCV